METPKESVFPKKTSDTQNFKMTNIFQSGSPFLSNAPDASQSNGDKRITFGENTL